MGLESTMLWLHNASQWKELVLQGVLTSRYLLLVKLESSNAEVALRRFTKAFLRVPKHLRKRWLMTEAWKWQGMKSWQVRPVWRYILQIRTVLGNEAPMKIWMGWSGTFFLREWNLSTVSQKELTKVEKLLNSKARKIHGFFTPQEVYTSILTGEPVALGAWDRLLLLSETPVRFLFSLRHQKSDIDVFSFLTSLASLS